MSITTKDHVSIGVDRLSYKLKQENVEKLLTIFLEQSQAIEDEFIDLANQKSIDIAEGIWLDYIGKILGVDRNGESDVDYRTSLKFKIGVNNADGTPNIIIDLIQQFTDSVSVRIAESGIAFATLSLNGQSNIGSELWRLLQQIRPVGTRWLIHSDIFDENFLFAYESSTSSSKVFQTTADGLVFENFEVTLDGIDYEPLFTVLESQGYYPSSLVQGRNSLYYEEPSPFQVTSNGVDYEDLGLNVPSITTQEFKVVVPYLEEYAPDYSIPRFWWEITEDSKNIEVV